MIKQSQMYTVESLYQNQCKSTNKVKHTLFVQPKDWKLFNVDVSHLAKAPYETWTEYVVELVWVAYLASVTIQTENLFVF